MEADKYLTLIQSELAKLPDYVNEYYLGTNHAVTTTYQYLTEIRRFFDWLRVSGLTDAQDNTGISTKALKNFGETISCFTSTTSNIPKMHRGG